VENYDEAIHSIIRHLVILDFKFVVFGIILIVIVASGVRKKYFSKIAFLWAGIVIAVCFSYPVYEVSAFYLDVKNEDYITYEGEFEFQYVLSNTGDNVKLVDENDRIVSNWYYDMESKMYQGKVVYTKRTKFVVYIEANDV